MGNNQDIIDSFLREELTPDEINTYTSLISQNKFLKSEYEITKLVTKALRERKLVYNLMGKWEEELQDDKQNIIKVLRYKKLATFGGSIAACMIVGILTYYLFINPGSQYEENTFAFQMPYFDSHEFVSSDYRYYTKKIDSLINVQDYNEALKLIEIIEPDFSDSIIKSKRDGVLQKANIGDNEVELNIGKYASDAYALEWRKINLLMALDQKGKALDILKKFVVVEGKYQDNAQELYKHLTINK